MNCPFYKIKRCIGGKCQWWTERGCYLWGEVISRALEKMGRESSEEVGKDGLKGD